MLVRLRNPDRDVEVAGPRKVRDVLADLGIDPALARQRVLDELRHAPGLT